MLAHRLDGIPPTIFSQMSALAVRTQSVNLGQGFPDADGPPEVIASAVRALESGLNQYAPGPGTPALRRAVHDDPEAVAALLRQLDYAVEPPTTPPR